MRKLDRRQGYGERNMKAVSDHDEARLHRSAPLGVGGRWEDWVRGPAPWHFCHGGPCGKNGVTDGREEEEERARPPITLIGKDLVFSVAPT